MFSLSVVFFRFFSFFLLKWIDLGRVGEKKKFIRITKIHNLVPGLALGRSRLDAEVGMHAWIITRIPATAHSTWWEFLVQWGDSL